MKRREMLTGLGVGTLLGLGLTNQEAEAVNVPNEADLWKYTKIDPKKAGDFAYEVYPEGACMYAAVRSLIATVADALQPGDPLAAAVLKGFPFQMMRYGNRGIGELGVVCGAFNGCAAVIGLFVDDEVQRNLMIQELCTYYEQTELPIYKPKDDKFPRMESSVSESVICHVSNSRWLAVAETTMFSPRRSDRCRRLAVDIVIKTAELLNRYHQDHACTFAPLVQPVATCYDCHGPGGMQADTIVKMNCATCHEHDEKHSNKYLK